MAKILVTGASGFIGKRLVVKLLQEGHVVFALVRVKDFSLFKHENLHLIYGDIRDPDFAQKIPLDIDASYFLVHSMGRLVQNLKEEEVDIAKRFTAALEKTACKQIIFLSGIVEDPKFVSEHLLSRLSVEKVLKASKIPSTVLRASIILGAGSASFEIIRDLSEKLPVMIAPKWVKNQAQPIAILDVLYYLEAVLLHPQCLNETFDIGGPEVLSFKEILQRYSKFRGLKRWIIDVPFLTPHLSSYWLVLITSVRFSICRYLVESMRFNTRKLNLKIDQILPHTCLKYEEALRIIFQKISHNEVVSTWMDAWNFDVPKPDLQSYIEVPQEGCLKNEQILVLHSPVEIVQSRIWSIGGKQGWYSLNWAWSIRGFIDKLLGGSGMNRGRRHPTELVVGDTVDFWKVIVADAEHHRLVLYALMKLPGEAWLEFSIDEKTNSFKQVATFRPKGFWGRVYWYASYPFHLRIFSHMAQKIVS